MSIAPVVPSPSPSPSAPSSLRSLLASRASFSSRPSSASSRHSSVSTTSLPSGIVLVGLGSDTSSSSSFSSPSSSRSHTASSSPSSTPAPSPIPPSRKIFAGLVFYIDKESNVKDRLKVASAIKEHGGAVAFVLSKKTTHFLTGEPFPLLSALKDAENVDASLVSQVPSSLVSQLNASIRLNVATASFEFVYESVRRDELAAEFTISYTKEIRLYAPEIVSLLAEYAPVPSPDPPGDTPAAADGAGGATDAADDAAVDDFNPEDAPVIDPLKTMMQTLAFTAAVLPAPLPPTCSTQTFVENSVQLQVLSVMAENTDGSTLSFEENRFYNYYVPGGEQGPIRLGLPQRAATDMGSVWAWGQGRKGQLAVGKKKNLFVPHYLPFDFRSPVLHVACGDAHTTIVTSNGAVWTWGITNYRARSKCCPEPTLVEELMEAKVRAVMVACGTAHTAVLTDGGAVWTWGSNRHMQLGLEASDIEAPCQVLSIINAVLIASGGHNTAIIDRYGDVYTLGSNEFCQRGATKSAFRKSAAAFPTKVQFPDEAKLKQVSVGQGTMGAVSVDGALYMWGRNLWCQCGVSAATCVASPETVAIGTQVVQISCGDTHVACVTANGDVFTWGWGPVGQLGHTLDLETCMHPTQLEGVPDISMVACGARHTVAVSARHGKVWFWGSNEHGQSGIPIYDAYGSDEDDEDDSTTSENTDTWLPPQLIDSLSKVSVLACGRYHIFALVKEDYVPFQFAKDGLDGALRSWLKRRNLPQDDVRAAIERIRDDEVASGYTLLHWAAYSSQPAVVSLLLNHRWIDANIADSSGDTALHICAQRDLPECAVALLESDQCNADTKNKAGKTAIHVSVENRTNEVLKEIVERAVCNKSLVDEQSNTPLHLAIRLRHFEMAKYLIETAAQPQLLDKLGKAPFDYCSIKEASYFKSLAQKNDVFISYAHADLEFATKIKEYLETHAIKCWMDMTRLEAGNDWRLDIGTGLLSSRLVLFIASRASLVSDWCIKELHMAKKHKLVIIPIWFQKVEFDSEVNSLIFGRRFIDFTLPDVFTEAGLQLAIKLKQVLQIVKLGKRNPYLITPVLPREKFLEQQFLAIMMESHVYHIQADTLEATLRNHAAIYSCTHTLEPLESRTFKKERQQDFDLAWGVVFLVQDLKAIKAVVEKWWAAALLKQKHVYLCVIHGTATDVKNADLPAQALAQTLVPIFYLESEMSVQQLIYFVHLAQRDEFMAKQVVVVQSKYTQSAAEYKKNDAELTAMKKRYYVE